VVQHGDGQIRGGGGRRATGGVGGGRMPMKEDKAELKDGRRWRWSDMWQCRALGKPFIRRNSNTNQS
jgi:hypothetical protein